MGLLNSLKKALGRPNEPQQTTDHRNETHDATAGPEELLVPEMTAAELLRVLDTAGKSRPVLLDCREDFERRFSSIPGSIHVPMNSIPYRLDELDPSADIVVYCAHGNRSYGVAGWLVHQGFNARSLKGGIVDWQREGGPIDSPSP